MCGLPSAVQRHAQQTWKTGGAMPISQPQRCPSGGFRLSTPHTPEDTHQISPETTVLRLLRGPWIAQSIHMAAKLRLADLVKNKPMPISELAQATGTHATSLYRLLRLLANFGIFTEVSAGHFGLTPLAATLRTDVPGSLNALATIYGEEMFWQPWGQIEYSIKTGETAFSRVFDKSLYAYLAERPETALLFDQAMSGLVSKIADAVAATYDFSSLRRIIDVGGGNGTLISAILHTYPEPLATLVDLEPVVKHAKKQLAEVGLTNRCACVAGDFFRAVPAGGDAYILSTVICNWDEERAITILKNCHRAMTKGSKLLLVEIVLPPGDTPSPGKMLDLQMMVITGGRDRTEAEYRTLLEAAGFTLTQVSPTHSERSVIEATPA